MFADINEMMVRQWYLCLKIFRYFFRYSDTFLNFWTMYFIYWKIFRFFSYVWNMSNNYSWNQKKYQRVGPQSVNIQETGTMVPWEWEASNDYCLSQVIASITFWWLLIKINIPVNEVQCKSIKGEKNQDFFIETTSALTRRNSQQWKQTM